jgi:hypothetical protein
MMNCGRVPEEVDWEGMSQVQSVRNVTVPYPKTAYPPPPLPVEIVFSCFNRTVTNIESLTYNFGMLTNQ